MSGGTMFEWDLSGEGRDSSATPERVPTIAEIRDWLDEIENHGGKIEFGRQRDDNGPFWRLAVNGRVYADKSLGACLDRAYREAHAT